MTDAVEGFRWLREVDYNVEWFAKYAPDIRLRLGHVHMESTGAADILEASIEHAQELLAGCRHLLTIIRETTTHG